VEAAAAQLEATNQVKELVVKEIGAALLLSETVREQAVAAEQVQLAKTQFQQSYQEMVAVEYYLI
jgi:ribosomal protein L14E/L6E/L27E